MIDRVIANSDRIVVVLTWLVLTLLIISWVVHEIEVKQNMNVVEGGKP